MTAYKTVLVDPFNRTLSEVQYSGNFHQIYELIGCETFDAARINRHGDALFVDDEGLYRGEQAFFKHADYPQPLAGKALLMGCDLDSGDSIAPTETIEEMREKVSWVVPMRTKSGDIVWIDHEGNLHIYE